MSDSPMAKAIAATLVTFAVQPLILPIINFQTYTAKNPSRPIRQTLKSFHNEHTLKEILYGTGGRMVNRAVYYGVTFLMLKNLEIKKVLITKKNRLNKVDFLFSSEVKQTRHDANKGLSLQGYARLIILMILDTSLHQNKYRVGESSYSRTLLDFHWKSLHLHGGDAIFLRLKKTGT